MNESVLNTAVVCDAAQTVESFGYQWTRLPDWSMTGEAYDRAIQWVLDKYGWKTKAGLAASLQACRRILDVGCGQGRELALFGEVSPRSFLVGLEPSQAALAAGRALGPARRALVIQADLFAAPFVNGGFDFIFANGVLHHTRNTYEAFARCRRLLSKGGELAAYVYRKKAPLREFSDDYLRAAVTRMSPSDAWETCRGLTELGQQLAGLGGEIELTRGIPLLGIRPGRHPVQRLLYHTVLKMFWDPARGFEGSTLVNFDWYHPAFAWRHTAEEVRGWCEELSLRIEWFHEDDSGITVRAIACDV
jgi:SAM-dependent methyltransferase